MVSQPHHRSHDDRPAFAPEDNRTGPRARDRREFLIGSWWALTAAALGRPTASPFAPSVEAVPTIFHGHPDGATTLIRFTASGVDAPAGRLRVFDTGRRLLGTAGMVRRGEILLGELWIPLARPLTVRSELETLVQRGAHRTTHRLVPSPRWVLRWLTLSDPETLAARFRGVPPLLHGTEAAVLTTAGVRLAPAHLPPVPTPDHLDLLRVAAAAAAVSARTGVPLGRLALVSANSQPVNLARALAASGIPQVLSVESVGHPSRLGFATGRAAMARQVEEWLVAQADGAAEHAAALVGTDIDTALAARPAVDEWNGLYAYPRIEVGDGSPALTTHTPSRPSRTAAPWDGTQSAQPFAPLIRAAGASPRTLEGLAARFALPVGGLLVFNPSPFARSDVVATPGGRPRVVTDVPGWGYAFVPTLGEAEQNALAAGSPSRDLGASTATFSVQLDPLTGAVASLVDSTTGRELVEVGGELNGVAGSALSEQVLERVPGVGIRLTARRLVGSDIVTSRVTVYDALPWVDFENTIGEGAGPFDFRFAFAAPADEVRREVAGGVVASPLPVERAPHLRWVALRSADHTVLVGFGQAGLTSVSSSHLLAHGSPPSTRMRIGVRDGYLLPDDPWRFGFGMVPLVGVPVAGTGDRGIATFGRMVSVLDPLIAVAGIKEADDGIGAVVYLMDLGGPSRRVEIRPALLAFDGAILSDLAERDQVVAESTPDGGVLVPIEASGYAAVRLLGVRVAG